MLHMRRLSTCILGEVLAEVGRSAEVQVAWERTRQLKPDAPRLRATLAKGKQKEK